MSRPGYTARVAEPARRPAGRALKLVILLLCLVALAMIVATSVMEWLFANTSGAREESDIGIALAFALIAVIGALAAMGQPRNAVGWVLLFSGLTIGLAGLGESLGYYLSDVQPEHVSLWLRDQAGTERRR